MKKISSIVLVLIMFITSCSSDDNETQVFENIIGTWIGTEITLQGEVKTEVNGQTILSTITGDGYDLNNELLFAKSPNTVTSEGNLNMKITYTINGVELTEDVENFEFLGDGIWEINGSELIITDPTLDVEDDDIRLVNILKLTETELIIKMTETVEEIEGGETITGVTEIVASFVKE
ncbi:hypothetical protein [uncultured Algibacter sp.]|uniref:hypothetical protein n=1 Tax=uncultured Algibacter sp. TaxID=298659 RepID=UPI00262929BE|nr:hypothetical protein [uncultured Algibacter sp.]